MGAAASDPFWRGIGTAWKLMSEDRLDLHGVRAEYVADFGGVCAGHVAVPDDNDDL